MQIENTGSDYSIVHLEATNFSSIVSTKTLIKRSKGVNLNVESIPRRIATASREPHFNLETINRLVDV